LAAARAVTAHVSHARRTIHLCFDSGGCGLFHRLRISTGKTAGYGNRGRRNIGILRNRKIDQRDDADQYNHHRDHNRRYRPSDKSFCYHINER